MNWLAHLLLSDPPIECQMGNVLADVIKGHDRRDLGPLYKLGLRCHREIDNFTDSHPLFQLSVARLPACWSRFAGILVDIYYDHILAKNWAKYCGETLEQVTGQFYQAASERLAELPPFAREVLSSMIRVDRLGSYQWLGGIQDALTKLSARISERVGRAIDLAPAIKDLEALDAALTEDFSQFFPALVEHICQWRKDVLATADPTLPVPFPDKPPAAAT
ncbi:MAG: ACP phosphodiesterase [Pirellulales bacterium]|nr:ACP phosphodiesterase [Pirellulales bacterium]